jgi:hypothetical protein
MDTWDLTEGDTGYYKVYNNTVIINSTSQVCFFVQNHSGSEYYNNICHNLSGTAGSSGGILTAYGGSATVDYNNWYGLGTDKSGSISGGTNDVDVDSDFVDETFDSVDDFKLNATSTTLIDGGTSYDSYSGNDYWGTSVPQNGTVDIGAHEFEDDASTIKGMTISQLIR